MTLFSAIRLANRVHKEQWRLDGSPYIDHLLCVLQLLWALSLELPKEVYIAGVLHDVLEDTDLTYEELLTIAGKDVAAVVRILTKDDQYYDLPKLEREKMYIKRILSFSDAYPYALLIKIIDRLHNIRTSYVLSSLKRRELLYETVTFYLPMIEDHIEILPVSTKILYEKALLTLKEAVIEHAESIDITVLTPPPPPHPVSLC